MDNVFCYILSLSLLVSLLANVFLVTKPFNSSEILQTKLQSGGSEWYQSGWSLIAAKEAEAVAAISCSGHGRAYLDGYMVHGKPICECNTCYGGPDCSHFRVDCAADVESGDPLFLEPFWMKHAAKSAIVVSGWHRMSYVYPDHSFISQELEKQIRKLHAIVKNAVTEGKYIVFGSGATQLVNTVVYALSNSTSRTKVVASSPFFTHYETSTVYFDSEKFEFEGEASGCKNTSDKVIEFVTSPNNPDGMLKKSVLKGPSVSIVYDYAYYWPHFTAISEPADHDIMLFTLSKLTGHAGSRLGWAIIRDKGVYERMLSYMHISEMGVSRDTQFRAIKLLKVITESKSRDIFDFGYSRMRDRWERLSRIISLSKRFTLQEIAPQYCTFFNKIRRPSPAYAWLKCQRKEDKECTAVLKEAKIIGRDGRLFKAESSNVRLSLLKRQDDFDLLEQRMYELISKEADKISNDTIQHVISYQ